MTALVSLMLMQCHITVCQHGADVSRPGWSTHALRHVMACTQTCECALHHLCYIMNLRVPVLQVQCQHTWTTIRAWSADEELPRIYGCVQREHVIILAAAAAMLWSQSCCEQKCASGSDAQQEHHLHLVVSWPITRPLHRPS